jgi:hypothetical protein
MDLQGQALDGPEPEFAILSTLACRSDKYITYEVTNYCLSPFQPSFLHHLLHLLGH